MRELDLSISSENVPSRLQRLRTNFKIFRTGFLTHALHAMELVPSLTPIDQKVLDKHSTSVGQFILGKGIGTDEFRTGVSEFVAEIQERNTPAPAAS